MITLYHNPACSKSREALSMLEQLTPQLEETLHVINYLETPLNATQLAQLHKLIGGAVSDMLRENDAELAGLTLDYANDDALIMALAAQPQLLQRPIVLHKGRAIIARPPSRMLALFGIAEPA